MRRILSLLFWSVIAAAFIGPGTVTTAASAGTLYGFTLMWTLVFSTAACLILQEASARLTIVSGSPLMASIGKTAGDLLRKPVQFFVLAAVISGCAAFEAGNILGSTSGLSLVFPGMDSRVFTLIIVGSAVVLLASGTIKTVARILGLVVAVMGICFLFTAVQIQPSLSLLARGTIIPSMPAGSGLVIMALIGTTVVPYNLFLGSGIAAGQTLRDLRFGLTGAVLLGGVISMAILITGSAIPGAFSFENLSQTLSDKIGPWARGLFAVGLFSAGFSSAVTAPMAAGIAVQQTISGSVSHHSASYRITWISVVFIGLIFGMLRIQPIPAIIFAQAMNGILLPLVAFFLLICVNDPELMGDRTNNLLSNSFMFPAVFATLVLGLNSLLKAFSAWITLSTAIIWIGACVLTCTAGFAALYWIRVKRRRQ
ncbi:MAG TPA: divalent metal cation transporter [bacterium]|nr:divalent metal cation transporter [bacterium]